jgi:hypothetical protein
MPPRPTAMSTTSRLSTTPWAMPPVTNFSSMWRRAFVPRFGPATPPRGWVEMSSSCSSTMWPRRGRRWSLLSGSQRGAPSAVRDRDRSADRDGQHRRRRGSGRPRNRRCCGRRRRYCDVRRETAWRGTMRALPRGSARAGVPTTTRAARLTGHPVDAGLMDQEAGAVSSRRGKQIRPRKHPHHDLIVRPSGLSRLLVPPTPGDRQSRVSKEAECR